MKNIGFNLYKHLRETVSETAIEEAAIVKMPAPIKLNESKHIVRPPVLKPAKTQVNESFFKEVLAEVVDNKISLSDIYDILPASSPNLVKSVLKMLAEEGVEVTNEGKIPSKPAEVTEETYKTLMEEKNKHDVSDFERAGTTPEEVKQIARKLYKDHPNGIPGDVFFQAVRNNSWLGALVLEKFKQVRSASINFKNPPKIEEALGNKETVLGEFSDEKIAKDMAREKNGVALINPETKKWKVVVKEGKLEEAKCVKCSKNFEGTKASKTGICPECYSKLNPEPEGEVVKESIQATIQTDTETIKVASDETGTKITTVDANDKETTIKVPKVEEPVAAPEVEVTPPTAETPIDSKEPEVEVKPQESKVNESDESVAKNMAKRTKLLDVLDRWVKEGNAGNSAQFEKELNSSLLRDSEEAYFGGGGFGIHTLGSNDWRNKGEQPKSLLFLRLFMGGTYKDHVIGYAIDGKFVPASAGFFAPQGKSASAISKFLDARYNPTTKPEVEVKPKEEEPIEEHKLKESYGMQSIIGDISRGMSKEEVIKKLQSRYPDITDESALEIYGDAKAGNSNSQGWLRKKKDVKESKEQNDEFQELLAQYHDAIDARDREKVKALGAQIDQLIDKVTETEKELKESKFQVGEVVWYEGKKWEIADHTKGQYLLWSPGKEHKEEIEDWIPQDYLAKVRESKEPIKESGDDFTLGFAESVVQSLKDVLGVEVKLEKAISKLKGMDRVGLTSLKTAVETQDAGTLKTFLNMILENKGA